MTFKSTNYTFGFTIFEIIVSVSLFLISIILVGSLYIFAQRSYNKGSGKAELSQNARVTLDRMSRELRQAVNVVAALSETDNDPQNPPPQEIFFQDGHDTSQITYLRYWLDGTNLMRQHKAYYFEVEPETYVAYNSVDQNNNPPLETTLSDNIIGEYFNNIQFWGTSGAINIAAELQNGQNGLEIKTSVYKRN
ncbi:hypothetical protein HY798_01090 [Candidatus Falkowbacteria bacterium]|nr:hypothetical protein [Candidatus Falkowbacteria bacterium]